MPSSPTVHRVTHGPRQALLGDVERPETFIVGGQSGIINP